MLKRSYQKLKKKQLAPLYYPSSIACFVVDPQMHCFSQIGLNNRQHSCDKLN